MPPTRYAYGCIPDRKDDRDHRLAERVDLVAVADLPPRIDLRVTHKLDFPIYDQGQLGSCTANAIAAALRYEAGQQELADIDPSRLWIYYRERELEGNVGTDAGAEIRDGLKVVAKQGWPPESDWPYDIARFADAPPAHADADALSDRVTKYMRVAVSPTALRQALASGFPVVVGFDVYESFELDAVAETGEVPMPARTEAVVGGHAVLCVGYDDTTLRFTCRNSWAAGWGQGGYFTIPYAYLGSTQYGRDFWAIEQEVEGEQPKPAPDPLHELAARLRQFTADITAWLARHGL